MKRFTSRTASAAFSSTSAQAAHHTRQTRGRGDSPFGVRAASNAVAIILVGATATTAGAAGTLGDFGKDLDWSTSLHHFQVDKEPYTGQRFEFNCPAKTVRDKEPVVHGTDRYPSDSAICPAAVHAGVIGPEGGRVHLQLNPGVESYKGSRRNGMETRDLPATALSIMFLSDANRAQLDEMQQKWKPRLKWDDKFSQTGLANIRLTGQRFAFDCPRAGSLAGRVVYGTDSYPLSSLVCLAAVHAGQITKDGGAVLVQLDPALAGSFVGSTRNDVESKKGPMTTRSISFPAIGVN